VTHSSSDRIVGVVGMGIVGGTIASRFEHAGFSVQGYDPYLEIGAPELLGKCSIVFLCVPTPSAGDGNHDVAAVWAAMHAIEPHLRAGTIVAMKSTVPPGTCTTLKAAFPRLNMASVPEFLVANDPISSFTQADRIVIGASSPEVAADISGYFAVVAPGVPTCFVAPGEAELIKLCSNALLAAKVSLANELSDICDRFGVAWPRVQAIVGLDRRIGRDHLTVTPERGFGGQCLPKDLDGLIAAARDAGYMPQLLERIADFNRSIRNEGAAAPPHLVPAWAELPPDEPHLIAVHPSDEEAAR
jgi:UDPglucose 6-dehydrogenase